MASSAAEVITFGCRLNAAESDAIADQLRAAGARDVAVVNTCAVTGEAEAQARQAIRRLARERPGVRIVVTGCAAEIGRERFAAMPEVAAVVGNRDKLRPETWGAPEAKDATAARPPEGRTRAFLEVQHGCDHDCTFCVIPLARGPSRSQPLDALIGRARALVERGTREIVLTGVDITAWGGDLPGRPALGRAVRGLLAKVPQLERLRLSSLDPAEIDEELWRALADEPRLMPHLHLSLQSADDLILKRMKRRHTRAQVEAVCARARLLRPGLAFGADVIAGFPTEDAAMFERTRSFLNSAGFDFLHVFAYSPRPGTPAARMPSVPPTVVRERAAILRADAAAGLRRHLARRVGSRARVLVERSGRFGHDEDFSPVRLASALPQGTVVDARVVAASAHELTAAPV